MNLRFPQLFALLMLATLLASVGLPRAASGRMTTSLQFLFSPLSAPVQWWLGDRAQREADDVATAEVVAAGTDDAAAARWAAERRDLIAQVETLRGQLGTLQARQRENERVGPQLQELVHAVPVIGVETGRDVLRLSGSGVPLTPGTAVACDAGIVGRIADVGVANQSSVRLITDRGFKLIARFIHPTAGGSEAVDLEPTLVEGAGGGAMRIESLKGEVVARAGLRVGDVAVLADDPAQHWPIELHGRRVGVITAIADSAANPGLAEIRLRPEADLLRLKSVWLILPPEMLPER